MAALRRNPGTWILILLLAAGFFLLREKRSNAATDLTISTARTFASLDGSADDDDGLVNGVFTKNANLTIAAGGSITCDDPATPSAANACPITLSVSGNLEIQAGGSIHAENNVGAGTGGNITMTVGGNFTMRGPSGGNPGAFVSSQKLGGGAQQGGDILIIVGGVTVAPDPVDPTAPGIGQCNTPTGDVLIEAGASIFSNSGTNRAGDIAVYAGHNITVHGTVEARGSTTGGHGGAITLDACCSLLIGDTGIVSSRGQDPGPSRVHLEACLVNIFGLVQSTGPAHSGPEPLCAPPERPTKPANSSGCVEIWSGTDLTIDATGTHHAEVHADVGFSGGTQGLGWVDLLANGNILINDGTGNDGANPNIPSPATDYAVHANMGLGNGHGGIVTVQSKSGSDSTLRAGASGQRHDKRRSRRNRHCRGRRRGQSCRRRRIQHGLDSGRGFHGRRRHQGGRHDRGPLLQRGHHRDTARIVERQRRTSRRQHHADLVRGAAPTRAPRHRARCPLAASAAARPRSPPRPTPSCRPPPAPPSASR